MTDGLSRTYADLLEGEYDCLDRLVLNAYFLLRLSPARLSHLVAAVIRQASTSRQPAIAEYGRALPASAPSRPAYRTRKPYQWQIAVERASYDMTIFKIYCGKIARKLYTKSERGLRAEAIALDARDLRCGRDLSQFAKAAKKLQTILERFLDALSCLDRSFVTADTLEQLPKPAQVGSVRVGGLDFHEGRTAAVAKSLQALSVQPRGFPASEFARQVQRYRPPKQPKYTARAGRV